MKKETLRAELNLQLVYQEMLPAVYRVAYTYMKNSFDSEDAAQETFIRLARSSRSFEDRRQLKAWLVVTVANVCKDMLRRRHRQDLNLDDYSELPKPRQDRDELLWAIQELPDKFKVVLYLYYYEGYSVREIGKAVNQSEGTVKSWLHRARRQLKRSMEEDQG